MVANGLAITPMDGKSTRLWSPTAGLFMRSLNAVIVSWNGSILVRESCEPQGSRRDLLFEPRDLARECCPPDKHFTSLVFCCVKV
jgi:hypothetical protein